MDDLTTTNTSEKTVHAQVKDMNAVIHRFAEDQLRRRINREISKELNWTREKYLSSTVFKR